jgi:hypothetical protein
MITVPGIHDIDHIRLVVWMSKVIRGIAIDHPVGLRKNIICNYKMFIYESTCLSWPE